MPAISNVPFGHGKHMATMPLGVRARLDGDGKRLEVLERGGRAATGDDNSFTSTRQQTQSREETND